MNVTILPRPGIETYPIESREQWLALRQRDVTASVVGALLGIHEYETPFGLWAAKTGNAPPEEDSAVLRRGRSLEPVALDELREKRPTWIVEPGRAYFRDPATRMGATPDAFAIDPTREGFGIVQIKTTDSFTFKEKWKAEDGAIEPPLWIAVQAIVEAHLTGASWACVAPLVIGRGLDLEVIDVPVHERLIRRVEEKAAEFWRIVESGEAPDPDFGRDGALIAHLYRDPNGEELDLSADNALPAILDEREALSATEKAAKARLDEIKAELLHRLGPATAARVADGRIIKAPVVNRGAYTVQPTSFRQLRVTKRGGKARASAPLTMPERF